MSGSAIDNAIYDTLGERWYQAHDDPIALLRAEARLRNPWVHAQLQQRFGARPCQVLDIGCGGGFLTNDLASRGHHVTGLDLAADSLRVAAAHDPTRSVRYLQANAEQLPFADGSLEAVCAMDMLEHVESPGAILAQVARVLCPGGLFFFHTFNRSWLSWLVVIKGVEWFVANTPRNLHVLPLFHRPRDLRTLCQSRGLHVTQLRGCRPRLNAAFFRMLLTREVSDDFEFVFTPSAPLGYTGVARRDG